MTAGEMRELSSLCLTPSKNLAARSRAHLTEENKDYDVEERICCFSTQRDYEDINLAMETSGLSEELFRQIQENTKCDDAMQDLIRHIKQCASCNCEHSTIFSHQR